MGRFSRISGGKRQVAPWIVIGVEGKATETGYFHAVRQRLRLSEKLVRIRSDGSSPLRVVQCAVREAQNARVEHGSHAGAQVWAVFDGEEHQVTVGQRHGWNDAIQLAAANEVQLGVSNPCFELWLLLHLRDQQAPLDRVAARRALAEELGGYEKSDAVEAKVRAGEEVAVARAEVLVERERRDRRGEFANPSTRVYELVRVLKGLGLVVRGLRQ